MIYSGTVRNGAVFETDMLQPEGVMVQLVSVTHTPAVSDAELDPFFRMDELAVEAGIPDLAENHDSYLYGLSEVDDSDAPRARLPGHERLARRPERERSAPRRRRRSLA